MKFRAAFFAVAALALGCALTVIARDSDPKNKRANLFANVGIEENSARSVVDSDILKRRIVRVNFEGLAPQLRIGETLKINLFEDIAFDGTVETIQERSKKKFTVSGRLEGEPFSTFTIAVNEGVFVMNLRTKAGEFYQVRHLENGLHEIQQVNETKFPECATEAKHAIVAQPRMAAKNGPQGDDAGDIIDVLVVYTTAARQAAGGTAAMEALVDLAVAESNTAFQESQITPRIRLVFQTEVSYSEIGFDANSTDLIRLTHPSDNFLDEVHALRNAYGADLVSLWIHDPSSCGVAWLMSNLSPSFEETAFGVVHWNCAVGNYSFAHELAHNMGCQHNREDSGGSGGLYPYSYGWRFTGNSSARYRTIMAYNTTPSYTRIQRFSNPDVLFDGVPTGVAIGQPNQSHNAQTINNSASVVANFRQTVSTNTPPIIIAQPQPQFVPINGTAVFNVAASGTMPLSFQWRKNGTNISGATTNKFTIENVQASDAGNYSVVITNGFGALTSSLVSLTISIPLGEVLDATQLTWNFGGNAPWIGQTNISFDGVDAAQSGDITHSQESWFETTVNGPGVLTYWCKVSSEANYDFLTFFLNGAQQSGALSGNIDWLKRTVNIPPGNHVCRWQYSKDFSDSVGEDKAWVDQVNYIRTYSLAEALDNGGFNWTTYGNAEWFGQDTVFHDVNDGNDAAQSGTILDEQFTALETKVVGPGTIRFWWKVSSEPIFDKLDFFINGNTEGFTEISGEVDWELKSFSIPPGTNTLRWEYSKDESNSAGQDKGWVDQIVYAAGSSFLPDTAQIVDGQFQFAFAGFAGASYTLQASTNLTDWVSLTNVIGDDVNIFISDTNAADFESRFYRIVSP